jgi:hypothetical protein
MHTFHRLARLSSVSALFLLSCLSFAQGPAPRIRGPIEANPSVALQGSLDPHVRSADDLGPLPPDTPIPGVTLVFNRSAAQQADLDQLVAAQTNPASPLFHHWLTPAEFAARFDIAASDITAAQSWLQSHGFTIDNVSRDRITFSGSAAQIQQAFGAELHRFRDPAGNPAGNPAELHFAPATELSLPPALAPVTSAVLHLSDFRPKPDVRAVRPDYTTLTSQEHFLDPEDVATMYNLWPLSTSFYYGTGQSIAIVGQSFVPTDNNSAIYHFPTDLTRVNFINPVIVPNSGMNAIFPGDEGEADIDLEYSSGIAQNATIFYVYTGSSGNYNVFDALSFAVAQDLAPVISVSYSACETLLGSSSAQQFNAMLQQAAVQGQTVVAASGDSGATACAPYSTQSATTAQQQAFAVGFPGSSPFVTAVGGTQMASGTFAAGASQYWATASGIDTVKSLLSYVPETVWNESSPSFGLVASGGGSSALFARPSWQSGVPGITAGSFRLVPDIALLAAVQDPGFIICSDDSDLTGATSDCTGNSLQDSNGSYALSGGTSFAAPTFAAFVAVLNQYEHTTGQGNINPVLYSLAAQPAIYATAFHDIATGTTACVAGVPLCGAAGQSSYAATTGYDMATGLGSVDFNRLAISWPSAVPPNLTPTSVAFSNSQSQLEGNTSATAGTTVTVNLVVNSTVQTGGFIAPTGTVSVVLDGQLLNPSLAITAPSANNVSSQVSFSFTAPAITGSHILWVRYPGDATHLPSIGSFAVLVGNVTPSGNFTLSAQNTTVVDNSTGSTQIAITPGGGYSGALTWSSSYTGGAATQTICYLVQSVAVNGPTTATMEIGTGTICGSASGSVVHSTVERSSSQPPARPSRKAPTAATFLALLLFGLFPARRTRKLLPILSTILLATLALTLTGCGGGSSTGGGGGGGGGGTGPQAYTITMTAKDSVNPSITASTSFTLTVD